MSATSPDVDAPERETAPDEAAPPSEPDATNAGGHEADAATAEARSQRFRRLGRLTFVVVIAGAAVFGYQAWQGTKRVELEEASIRAPQISLPAREGGTLKQVYVSVGDDVLPHRPIARVGNEVITSDVPATVVSVRDDVGASIPSGTVVVNLIDRSDLRAVGLVDEDGGLADLRVGQRADIEVDAFGGRSFHGYVEEIASRPRRQAVSFSISEKEEARQYEVKVHFDGAVPADLRQGMSAEVEVHK